MQQNGTSLTRIDDNESSYTYHCEYNENAHVKHLFHWTPQLGAGWTTLASLLSFECPSERGFTTLILEHGTRHLKRSLKLERAQSMRLACRGATEQERGPLP